RTRRGRGMRRRGKAAAEAGFAAAIVRTRSRRLSGAAGRDARSSSVRSAEVIVHPLLESLQGAAEPGRAGRLADAEQTGRRLAVELEHDAENDHLALACGERRERRLELRRQPFDE